MADWCTKIIYRSVNCKKKKKKKEQQSHRLPRSFKAVTPCCEGIRQLSYFDFSSRELSFRARSSSSGEYGNRYLYKQLVK